MNVAFLSDIHANFPALCAALESSAQLGAQTVICCGDVAGGGPHPTEVVRLLMERAIPTVMGNQDRKILTWSRHEKKRRRALKKDQSASAAWAAATLGRRELEWLAACPAKLELVFGDTRVLAVHGSPVSDVDYMFPSITPEALAGKLGEETPDMLVCGHSHIPFVKRLRGVLVANGGSVGQPVDGDPRGSFVLAQFGGPGQPTARVVRFAYPIAPLEKDLASRKVPGVAPGSYRHGVKG